MDGQLDRQTDKLAQKMIIGHSSKVDLSISRLLYGGRENSNRLSVNVIITFFHFLCLGEVFYNYL